MNIQNYRFAYYAISFQERISLSLTQKQKIILASVSTVFALLATLYFVIRHCSFTAKQIDKSNSKSLSKQLDPVYAETLFDSPNPPSKQVNQKQKNLKEILSSGNLTEFFSYINQHGLEIKELDLTYLKLNNKKELEEIINKCPNLEYLHLKNNIFAYLEARDGSFLEPLKGLIYLKSLRLCCSGIDDASFEYIKYLFSLQSLNLYDCHTLTDKSIHAFADKSIDDSFNLNSLQSLHLESDDSNLYNKITDHGLKPLKNLVSLQSLSLNLSCSQISDAGLEHLKSLNSLQSLNLSNCHQISDVGLEHLKGLNSLQSLNLSGCYQISDVGLEHLKGLNSLQSLNLSGCYQISNTVLEFLKDLDSLQSLNLSNCHQINNASLEHLKSLVFLQSLDLSYCHQISDTALEFLKDLDSLQSLKLNSCYKISNAGLEHLKSLVSLRFLSLNHCDKISDMGFEYLKDLISL